MKVVDVVKETKEYKIVKKRSGRYGVLKAKSRTWINGEEKLAILVKEGLVKIAVAQPKVEEPAVEETTEEVATEETEA